LKTETKTNPCLDIDIPVAPVAHLADKMQGCVTEGDYALCGAKLKGINLTDSARRCKKCKEIAMRRMYGGSA
tara:strand:- start:56537 stop:56752 length:216 start_codon:yes stop_codon:yes gene_type:complete